LGPHVQVVGLPLACEPVGHAVHVSASVAAAPLLKKLDGHAQGSAPE
jgi:hypothetical protein